MSNDKHAGLFYVQFKPFTIYSFTIYHLSGAKVLPTNQSINQPIFRIINAERRTRNTEHGTRNTEHGTRNAEHGTRNTEQINV